MTQIQLRQECFQVNYQTEQLPALFSHQPRDCDFSSSNVLQEYDSHQLISFIKNARQTLLIACCQLKDADLIQTIKEKSDRGVRVYLLLGEAKSNQAAIDTLSGRCLVRSGVDQKGVLTLLDHTTTHKQGLLLMEQQTLSVSDKKSWVIQLESEQIDDSFRSFCKLFWEDSDNEYLEQNQSQKIVNNPDGKVVTNHSHQLCGTLKDCLDETLNNLTGVSDFSVENLESSFQVLLKSSTSNIDQIARDGVVLTDRAVPSILLSDAGNWLLPDSIDFNMANWCLKLSKTQSKDLNRAYSQAVANAAWQYESEVTIGSFQDKQSLRFADKPESIQVIEKNRTLTLDPIITDTIDSFLEDRAEFLASDAVKWQPNFMAYQIDYQVTIHPPYCPSKAQKDSLYDEWTRAEDSWQEKLTSLTYQQKIINDKQAGFADRLKGFLKGYLLGEGQSVKKLNQELDVLKEWSVTKATPADRAEFKKRFENCHAKIIQRGNDTEEKLNEAEQNHRWEVKREDLLKVLNDKMAISNGKVEQQGQILSHVKGWQQQADSDFFTAWKEAVTSMTDKKMGDAKVNDLQYQQFLPEVLPEKEESKVALTTLAQDECIRLKRETLSGMTLEQAEQWKKSFKEKVWNKHYRDFNKALNNRHLALQKIERDIQESNKAVQGAQSVLNNAQNNLNAHGDRFIYQSKKESKAFEQQLGLKETGFKLASFSWPDEELPVESTELRSHNKQRFLVIFEMTKLDQARDDASRLNAKIVCDKECLSA